MDRITVMGLVRSFQVGAISQREFVVRATAAIGSSGTATALLTACEKLTSDDEMPDPVIAEGLTSLELTEKDCEKGLRTSIAEYQNLDDSSETLYAYYALPENRKSLHGVIVIQEWWGLNDHIKDV